MLHDEIRKRTQAWVARPDCPVSPILAHIRERGKLRDAQVEAIETWLYLKIEGGAKPLWRLFAEGFFSPDVDLGALHVAQTTREVLEQDPAARVLYLFAAERVGTKERLPALAQAIREHPEDVDYEAVIRDIFYDEDYADYLFSLPMGAGKTFLIAALIHLDLYFALANPDDPAFAHNFLVLIPSGLKSSIVPSLRTIEHFDPTWVLPEPAASEVHRLIRLDVLDEAKAGKKSNKARNPNAAKVAACAPFEDALGHVFIVNAEKVILNRVPTDPDLFDELEKSADEKDREENELRNLLGKLPRLAIHIDEVHHAQTDDIKLRQVVNRWTEQGAVNTVLGYSGTPYLASPDRIDAGGVELRFPQITNTVYHYPLTRAIETFLKTPHVEVALNLEPLEIIERGVKDFYERYGDTVYADGTCAKLAIYCGKIDRLEEEIRPFLTGTLGVPEDEILVYHQGNKRHPIPKENEAAFRLLDQPESRKRVILLVQIGKEGWDCRSLTGVILAQKGDSPSNMVLQTSCRCLRQVTPEDDDATAVIWLNKFNADKLNAQLKTEQHTSIEELNTLGRGDGADLVQRHDRTAHLGLPPVSFVQLRVRHTEEVTEEADPAKALAALVTELEATPSPFLRTGYIEERGLTDGAAQRRTLVAATGAEPALYPAWLAALHRTGLGVPTWPDLRRHDAVLRRVFDRLTYTDESGRRLFNDLLDRAEVERRIRLAFHARRTLHTEAETVPEEARLLRVDVLAPIERNPLLYPSDAEVAEILRRDAAGESGEGLTDEEQAAIRALEAIGQGAMAADLRERGTALPVRMKDRSFHFLPYSFKGSRLEKDTLCHVLSLDDFRDRPDLQVFFNGERLGQNSLSGFRIECFEQRNGRWLRLGFYTPDFLVIQRGEDGRFRRVLIVETKGGGFANQDFQKKRGFMEDWFLPRNNEREGGDTRFEYLVLSDDDDEATRLAQLGACIRAFFATEPAAQPAA